MKKRRNKKSKNSKAGFKNTDFSFLLFGQTKAKNKLKNAGIQFHETSKNGISTVLKSVENSKKTVQKRCSK